MASTTSKNVSSVCSASEGSTTGDELLATSVNPFVSRRVRERPRAGEEVIVVLAREMPSLRAKDDPHLQALARAHADPGVHDQVLPDPLGQDDLVAEGAEDLEPGADERLLQLLGGIRGHSWGGRAGGGEPAGERCP